MDNHPCHIKESTKIPSSIIKQRDWERLGYYKDHLAIGHYISYLFGEVNYLMLKSGYGTSADALLDNHCTITCTDDDESEINTMSSKVRGSFRVADITSPSQFIGNFNVVFSVEMPIGLDPELVSDFIDHHNSSSVFLLFADDVDIDIWVSSFEKRGFTYQSELCEFIKHKLANKLHIVKLDTLIIFTKERERAWSREDA